MARRTRKARFNANIIYVLASVFSIAFLVFSIFFTNFAQEKNVEQMRSYLHDSTYQITQLLNTQFQEDIHSLTSTARLYEKTLQNGRTAEQALASLMDDTGGNRFVSIGVGNKNGHASIIGENGSIAMEGGFLEYPGYKDALAGKNVISDIMEDKEGNTYYYNFVPLGDRHVLFGKSTGDRLKRLLIESALGKPGYSYLIDSTGQILLTGKENTPFTVKENILDPYPPLAADLRQSMSEDLAEGHSNSQRRKQFYGQDALWGAYAPLEFNNWFVFYAIPEPLINFGYDLLTSGMVTIVITAVVIFVFFILLIRNINRMNMRSLQEQVYTDPLTGQHTFQKFLIDAKLLIDLHHKTKYAVWYCDIKNFKYINDLLGYGTGDDVLKYWATILQQDTRRNETFGRVSADNFVLLREYESDEEVEQRFQMHAELLSNFNETAAHGYRVELSAGVYLLDMEKDSELTLNDMLDRANLAQKSVKQMRGSRCAIYSNEMRQKIIHETEMELCMESALADGEFEVYLQPKIAIREDNRVIGAEALVRWNWPGRGLVPPNEFIPLFEKNGFIVQLDEYMMETVCRMYREHILDVNMPEITLCVNVSRVGIYQQNFIERYVEIKDRYAIPSGCLELEFTESIAFEDHERFQAIVRELQKNGFMCSLDDFGSGHSSLNILKDLSVDVLKIDRLFFLPGQDARRDHDLIQSIINMARALNMITVAEGVENKEQVEDLREMSCDIVQGFVFAKPMPVAEFHRYLLKVNGLAG